MLSTPSVASWRRRFFRARRLPSGQEKPQLQRAFAPAFFFQMPSSSLKQVIQRNEPQELSRRTIHHRQPRKSFFRHAIYNHAQWFIWIRDDRTRSHKLTKRPPQQRIAVFRQGFA
jgi:hypothetical protein